MTALCGGGPSGPQSGVQTVITLSGAAIEAFLSGIGFAEVAPILAPIIAAAFSVNVAAYCATDPPTDPGLTAADVATALAFPASGQTIAAQQKILQWFGSRYWYQICHCTSTTTPAAPTPSNPGNTSTNPGLPQATSAQCWNLVVPFVVNARPAAGANEYADLTAAGQPAGAVTPILVQSGTFPRTIQTQALPPGLSNGRLSLQLDQAVATNATSVQGLFQGFTSGGAVAPGTAMGDIWQNPGGHTPGVSTVLPTFGPTGVTWGLYIQSSDTIQHSGTLSIAWSCPPGTSFSQPCCAPDPILQGLLEQILALEQAIYSGLPIPLTSFAEGTSHAGLSGLGTVAISPLSVGIKVVLTTIPSWVGSNVLSEPAFYFDAGFIGFATSEGTYAQQRIEHADQVFTVPPLGYTVEYTLNSGIVATIVELTRGP